MARAIQEGVPFDSLMKLNALLSSLESQDKLPLIRVECSQSKILVDPSKSFFYIPAAVSHSLMLQLHTNLGNVLMTLPYPQVNSQNPLASQALSLHSSNSLVTNQARTVFVFFLLLDIALKSRIDFCLSSPLEP